MQVQEHPPGDPPYRVLGHLGEHPVAQLVEKHRCGAKQPICGETSSHCLSNMSIYIKYEVVGGIWKAIAVPSLVDYLGILNDLCISLFRHVNFYNLENFSRLFFNVLEIFILQGG